MKLAKFLMPLAVAALAPACVAIPSVPQTYSINTGFFANSGMVIESANGTWKLTGGESFTPPFESDMYCSTCSNAYSGQVELLDPDALIRAGGQRVTVSTADGTRLNGILVLNRVFGQTQVGGPGAYKFYGPSLRSYELSIPQARIDQAKTGRIAVAYEVFAELPAAYNYSGQDLTYYSWVLMLSRTPL